MAVMQALILDAEARTATVRDIPRPSPAPNELLIRVFTISLNPVDSLYVASPLGSTGRIIGSDFAGEILELGINVPRSDDIRIGTRVAGFLQGACSVNEHPGAFCDFLVVPWDLVWKLPDEISYEQAAGVSLVALTAAQAIWCRLGLPSPFDYDSEGMLKEHPAWSQDNVWNESQNDTINVLIYGASTSVALFAAQMVHLSAEKSGKNVKLFGTASRKRWDMLKQRPYAYDHLVDYKDHDWPQQIMHLIGEVGIHYAFDCISEGLSVSHTCSTLHPNGKVAVVRSREGGAWTSCNVSGDPSYGAVWEGLGEEVQYQGFTIKQSHSLRAFSVRFYRWLGDAIGAELQPNPIRLMHGGLDKVVADGFRLLGGADMGDRMSGSTEEWMKPISAEKLVYKLRQ